MKLRFLATDNAPGYTISSETINGLDFSIVEHGGKFVGSDETRAAGIRNAERDSDGELWVTLCQQVGPGHWTESDWIDAKDYDPKKVYVKFLNKPFAGQPWVKNGHGEVQYA